MDKVQKQFVYY